MPAYCRTYHVQVPKPAPAPTAGAAAAAAAPTPTNGSSPPAPLPGNVKDNHHAALLALIADQLGCSVEDVVDFELNLCDVQPGVLGGAADEFVFVGRLDNLASCYTALEVRTHAPEGTQGSGPPSTQMQLSNASACCVLPLCF